jgi:hypothetical protein
MRLDYTGLNRFPSACDVRVYHRDNQTIIVCTDLNEGTSVTNAWPFLADIVCKTFSVPPCNHIIWVEHYDAKLHREQETWDRVFMVLKGGRFIMSPTQHPWKHLTEQQYNELVGTCHDASTV